MLTVIYAEFTNTKLAIDTTYSLSTKSLSKMSSILLDSSSSSRIVVWDPLHWSGLPSKAFTNEQRKLWFVAQRNSQPADKTEYNTVKLSHSGKGSCYGLLRLAHGNLYDTIGPALKSVALQQWRLVKTLLRLFTNWGASTSNSQQQ